VCYERIVRWLWLLPFIVGACRDTGDSANDGGIDGDGFPYPPPKTDAFQRLGSPDTLEIAAWNIENYPAFSMTPSRVADLIASLDLDIIVVEEIASETAWRELMDRLRDHDGILSEHRYTPTDYQKIGIIYKTAMVTPGVVSLMFTSDTYAFPRPPHSVHLTIDDGVHRAMTIRTIGVHLKAGVTAEDGDRRRLAMSALDQQLRAEIAGGQEDEIVIAGDYNEVLNTTIGQMNFAPLLSMPAVYTIQTQVASDRGDISFVPSSVLLDHITTTAALADDLAGAQLVIPRLHTLPGYVSEVSDHLPVVLIAPLAAK
jgi:endonuclease/exonuclease/phosphatase family metal-dependent hydrolase